MNIIQELATWAKKLPAWQSDAVRRLVVQDSLSNDDEEELCSMLFHQFKLLGPSESASTPRPFSELIEDAQGHPKKVLLKELHDVSAVNALLPDQSLQFSLEGMTVIYGENGAGKSGYARVFKHACFAREKSGQILSDVTASTAATPTATIELVVDNEDVAVHWQSNSPTSELIAEIAVFDSHCARVFLNDANDVVCMPSGMEVFRRLATLCDALSKRVQTQLALIPSALACAGQFSDATVVGQLVRTLRADSDLNRLDALERMDGKAIFRRDELRAIMASAAANPPKQKAAELRRTKQRFQQLLKSVQGIDVALSGSALAQYRQLCESASSAAEASKLASSEAFKNEPISGISSNPWRQLYEAAKRFSEEIAYPGETFPVTRKDAACVWCQQTISIETADRLTRFHTYVLDDAAKRQREADSKLSTAVGQLHALNVNPFAQDAGLSDELRSRRGDAADAIEEYLRTADTRKASIVTACTSHQWHLIAPPLVSVAPSLTALVDSLESEAITYDQADKPEELTKLRTELLELEDRTRLSTYSGEIKAFVAANKREGALRECERSLDTRAITRFGTELMESTVTEQLVDAFDRELKAFSVGCIPLSLKRSGEKGKTRYQLMLESGVRPSDVLSEGEQRVVAFASFLAELTIANGAPPIVIDDPVSSLDHVYRERVAARLVEEAKGRQVVVFTHDIVLLLALERGCAEQAVPLLVHTVRRSARGPGECPNPPARPWHACSTKDRIGYLKNTSSKFTNMEKESPDDYQPAVADFYGKLRETWERIVEEVLLNDAIQRFRPGIETQRLKKVRIEPADYQAISVAMTKCSTHMTGHDAAAALGYKSPTAQEVAADIKTCEDFVKALRKRQEDAAEAADTLLSAPAPVLSTTRATRIVKLYVAVA